MQVRAGRLERAHIVDQEEVGAEASREVVLDARLLAAQKVSHGGVRSIEVRGKVAVAKVEA